MKLSSVITFVLMSISALHGQSFSVKGVVMNSATKETIPICNVYFSGSTIGTMTDADGNFTIPNVRPGNYDLIVSHINYDLRSFPITISDKDIDMGKVLLKEKKVEVSYAEVKDKVDRKWRRQFARFKQYMLGKYYREKDIDIPNAYVAEFRDVSGTLLKKSSFALEINNNYTGYKIFYPVEEFLLGQGAQQYLVGFPRFTLLTSDDPRQIERWKANRKRSYEGSIRHFFKSLIAYELEPNLFTSYMTNDDPLTRDDEEAGQYRYRKPIQAWPQPELIKIEDTKDPRIKKISWKEFLEVNYLKEPGPDGKKQRTYLKANDGFVYVYTNGLLIDPRSITAYGYLSTEGLYEMLPFDFELDN